MKIEYIFFNHKQVHWWWMGHVATTNFWIHSLATLVSKFFCTCFVHTWPQPRSTPPPILCSIPLICTHWIQNPSKACIWDDTKFCHKICFITNATLAKALTKILITRHICKIVKSDYHLQHVCPSVRLSIGMEQFCFHLKDFQEN
jgi:hypothetical protein